MLGSGGSIITVPVLVYLFGQDAKEAVTGSLFVVGVIALAGAIGYLRSRKVDLCAAALFGAPGMAGTLAGAWVSHFVPGAVQLSLFAVIMATAAVFMLRGGRSPATGRGSDEIVPQTSPPRAAAARIGVAGVGVGALTGLVGVGGGFLIVPALVAAARLDVNRAVGTSLAVITLNCAVGFAQHSVGQPAELDWVALLTVTAIGLGGSLLGQRFASRLSPRALRVAFGAMLILIAIAILVDELPELLHS
jgi:uncharacterized membrane protein YfcA